MLKKLALGTMTAAAIGGLVFGGSAFSYLRTGMHTAQKRIRSEVPLEFEIERARQEVAQLVPEVRRSMHLIAEEQVEVASLQESIVKREESLASQEEAILSLSADLKSGDSHFVYAGRAYKQREVEKDLAERFDRFKVAQETLDREKDLLRTKEQALFAHRETLEGMLSQRKSLEVELERLEARLRTINSRKQIASIQVDDSKLNRVKSLISTIDKRLDVEDAVLAADGEFSGLIPVENNIEVDNENIANAVEDYFGNRHKKDFVQVTD
ncbi:hypothetical protein AB1L42_18130 [Thalassoglobus sp. JC818]|uniref:hypothetical protein n=1 Tax=Thalassoglobus sp. JC818 TaxID=3232136 RepID=UPI00345A2B99